MRSEFTGDIISVRAVEDTIHATKKYTKGAFSRPKQPIQGEDFPSRVLTEYYEVYPEVEISLDMGIIDAVFWLAGDTPHIDVVFRYNYLRNSAMVLVYGGNGVVNMLKGGIPGFGDALAKVGKNGHKAE